MATWEKVRFLWWEGEGLGTVYKGKQSLKSMLKYHISTYFLLTPNYFCIYTWGYSLCLDLNAPAGGFLKILQNPTFFPTSTIVLVPSVAFDFIFLTLFPITTAAINTRFFFWLFDITLIAMHILCLFKNKAGEYVFEKRIFRTVWYRKLFFPQLFEQHSSFENSCRSQFFVTVVQILCFLSLTKSSIEAIFHTMCYICVCRCVNINTYTHIHTCKNRHIYMRVKWKAYLFLPRFKDLF